jgi:ubiquinone/menaquinone biosynthesis C-methylase UbiE
MSEEATKFSIEQDSKKESKISLYDRLHLKMISIVHDTLYGLFVDGYRLLTAAGLAKGQTVLEVGCGPGFFTIPAAEIVGRDGHLFSLDINPAAVQRVREKIDKKDFKNVDVIQTDTSKTGLRDESVDLAFLFGVLHSLKDLDAVLLELHRILNNQGVVAVQKSSWSETRLLDRFTSHGLFHLVGKEKNVYRFAKSDSEDEEPSYQLTIED